MTITEKTNSLSLPPGNTTLFFIQNFWLAITNFEKFIQKYSQKYGDIYKIRFLGKNFIVFNKRQANEFILKNENNYFVSTTLENSKAIFGENTLSWQRGKEHSNKRKILFKALQKQALAGYIDCIEKTTQKYLEKWEKSGQIIWYPELKSYSFDVLAELFAGIESASLRGMITDFEKMNAGLFARAIPFPWSKYGQALQSRNKIHFWIEQSISTHNQKNKSSANALSILITAKDNQGNTLSSVELKEQIINLIFLGYKELSSALTSFCLLMAQNEEIPIKIRQEQEQIKKLNLTSLEKIKAMNYLERVLKEVLRLIPPVAGSFRKATKECSFQGYLIPKDWTVLYTIRSTHQDPKIYSQPEKFDPDRFNPERAEDKKQPYSYIPFGGGARECVGKELAFLVMKIFASTIVDSYTWKLLPKQDLTISGLDLAKPKDGLKVSIEKIS